MLTKQKLERLSRTTIVLVFILLLVAPLYVHKTANAYSLPSSRFIKMSSSAVGTITAGTDVVYQVNFITNQNNSPATIGALVVEFCSGANGPNIGATCTAPAGFNAHAFTGDNTLDVPLAKQSGVTDWQKNLTNATANRVILTRSGGPASVNNGVTINLELGNEDVADNGIKNPTAVNTTFYARILTFATVVGAQEYESDDIDDLNNDTGAPNGSPHVVHDAGGVAMSTAEQITITAKVPEKLTFCIFTTDGTPANTCGSSTPVQGNAVTLGDTTGVLSDTGPFVDKNAKYTIASNALNGVAIRVKGGTLKTSPGCGNTSGLNCSIDAIGATAVVSAPGSEQFGFCTYRDTATSTGLTPIPRYDGTGGTGGDTCANTTQTAGTATPGGAGTSKFAFDTNDTTGSLSTYGESFANSVVSTYSTGIIAFIGNITTTTEAGIYTTTLTFIATGTY